MPVTIEEKLRQRLEGTQDPNVSLEQKLRQRLDEQVGQPPQADEQRVSQLFEQLGGRLPGKDPVPVAAFPGPVEEKRRRAFQELIALDFAPEQIKLSLQAQKMLGGLRTGRGVGGMLGALGVTAIAGRFIPGPIDDAAIMIGLIAAGGAGIGGVAG